MMLEERWDYSLRGLTAFISMKAEAVLVVLSIRRVVSECLLSSTRLERKQLTGQIRLLPGDNRRIDISIPPAHTHTAHYCTDAHWGSGNYAIIHAFCVFQQES